MQSFRRLACKNVYRPNYMQFAGKNTRIADKNTRRTQAKIHTQSQAEMPAIAPKNDFNCRQSAIKPRVNSPENCK